MAEKLGLALAWATTLLFRMRDDHLIFTVGSKRNEKHYIVQVYHTDPSFVYIAPEPPKLADPIAEENGCPLGAARIPSVAAVDRGLALIKKHFHEDGRGKLVFEQLCRRPQSVPELSAVLKMDERQVYAVVEVNE